jgi:putative ATP-binding cassette transporter
LLALNVAQMWLNLRTKVKLREGLVHDLFNEWLQPRRAFRLASAGEIGLNPDQRVHEDARHLTELSTDLGIGLLQASLLLGSFIGVLWILSRGITLRLNGESFVIPGYLVWSALVYAGTASWLSWRVGRPLIALNAERYAREAKLRFALVRVSEHIDGIALYGGEADEKQRLNVAFDRVLRIMRRIVRRDDDGGGRLHSGAAGIAVVHRQLQRHRGLAGHAAASRQLPAGGGEHGQAGYGRRPDCV